MITKNLEFYTRLGLDFRSGGAFIRCVDRYIPSMIADDLGMSSREIHDLTCGIKKLQGLSKTGDRYNATKILHIKVKVSLECELENDAVLSEEDYSYYKDLARWIENFGGSKESFDLRKRNKVIK